MKKRNGIIGIPPMMTSEKWRTMSTNEKYTAVFGPQDPSRRKLEDLPYFVKLVSRETEGKCVFCRREECSGCPLRFDDKVTLRQILEEAKVATESNFYYEEHKPVLLQTKKVVKAKKKVTRQQAQRSSGSYQEDLQLPVSDEFEITVQFNARRCWALYSCLNRFVKYEDSNFKGEH